MLANLMNVAGVNHVITVDLHASQMQGFFKCPVDNLVAEPLLAKWIKNNIPDWQESVVVSKNPGGTKRVTSLADALRLSFGIVTTDRRRPYTASNSMMNSVVFEPMGTDGTADKKHFENEEEEQAIDMTPGAAPIEHDFAQKRTESNAGITHLQNTGRRPSRPRAVTTMASGARARLVNADKDLPPSPLARSTRIGSIDSPELPINPLRRMTTAPGVTQPPPDEDGYESPEGDEIEDEVRLGNFVCEAHH